MQKQRFLDEVARQLRTIFGAINEGRKPPGILKHRCEGFMPAGVYLDVVSNAESSCIVGGNPTRSRRHDHRRTQSQ